MANHYFSMSGFHDAEHIKRYKVKLITEVLTTISNKLFGKAFLESMSFNDLEKLGQQQLSAILETVASLAATKKAGAHKISIFEISDLNRQDLVQTSLAFINDDKPFLVDSISSALLKLGYTIDTLIHPIIATERDEQGHLRSATLALPDAPHQKKESTIYVRLNEHLTEKEKHALEKELENVLLAVESAVIDWHAIRKQVATVAAELTPQENSPQKEERGQIKEFLLWLDSGFFTFLGSREYKFEKNQYIPVKNLGILKHDDTRLFEPDLEKKEPLLIPDENFKITKSVLRSTVHRDAPMDIIFIKKQDAEGKVVGLYQFVGLFTSTVYNGSVKQIPFLKEKVSQVVESSGLSPMWHDGKALIHTIETFPRDELFQMSAPRLLECMRSVLELQERQHLALFIRPDALKHLVSVIVYVPRDRYNSDLRERMASILESELNGHVTSFHPLLDRDTPYARVYYTIAVDFSKELQYHHISLEKALLLASMTWEDHLKEALFKRYPAKIAQGYVDRFLNGFSGHYKETYSFDVAVEEIQTIEKTIESAAMIAHIAPIRTSPRQLHLKLYKIGNPFVLAEIIPILDHMGLRILTESYYKIRDQKNHTLVCLYDFKLESLSDNVHDTLSEIKNNFEEAIVKVWEHTIESDGFNSLILNGNLLWQEVIILRSYYKYLKQIDFTYSQPFVEDTLRRNAPITRLLVNFFKAMFDPVQNASHDAMNTLLEEINTLLEGVENSDDDKILRRFLNLILATVRTNYFQTHKGNPKDYTILKFDCRMIQNLPQPKPLFETFLSSKDVEAIHLRMGKVSRGGIRWSDRPEDFRKEILGLVKAQRVKNAVIVPAGAKGGFVVKKDLSHATPEEKYAEGVRCYKIFMQALLDITDNLQGKKVIKPKNVRCHDEDDPYLVVAADKGTATFSDIANSISTENHFWLGDAFASGGSYGYDHKKMGITARGAWESVKRHFREMGMNTQETPFTVVGVGDMAGDVFGNGMLLSDKIKLVAAFNHAHIFIDPNPDPETSFKERKRLFNLPRSAWSDYNAELISKGGGVFSRKQKTVTLSPEIASLLGITGKTATPEEVIRAILKSPVDLLWFGGIGTFIKSSQENNETIGDKTNDALRISAIEVQAKVIGEGANLGVTQRGRIEFALKGGRINTDAIDNSAGVDCSDHEVNIKILLNEAIREKRITEEERNKILSTMTDEVASLVLRDNYIQTQTITMVESRGSQALERQGRFMKSLEKSGHLERRIEFLPTDEDLEERAKSHKALTRPEISVLLAYGKMSLYDTVMQTSIPDAAILKGLLTSYFPKKLQEMFGDLIEKHPLKREIIGTRIANSIVNRAGPTFFLELADTMKKTPEEILSAYIIARDSMHIWECWHDIEKLDGTVTTSIQSEMMRVILENLEQSTRWLLAHYQGELDVSKCIPFFEKGINDFKEHAKKNMKGILMAHVAIAKDRFVEMNVPEKLASEIASFEMMQSVWGIIDIAQKFNQSIEDVSDIYFSLNDLFELFFVQQKIRLIPTADKWSKHSAQLLLIHMTALQGMMTQNILKLAKPGMNAQTAYDNWCDLHKEKIEETQWTLDAFQAEPVFSVSMAYIFLNHLEGLTR